MTEKKEQKPKQVKKKRQEKKYVLLDLIRESEIDNNVIIGALTTDEFKIYTNELITEAYEHTNNPIITRTEFNKIIKRIGE